MAAMARSEHETSAQLKHPPYHRHETQTFSTRYYPSYFIFYHQVGEKLFLNSALTEIVRAIPAIHDLRTRRHIWVKNAELCSV